MLDFSVRRDLPFLVPMDGMNLGWRRLGSRRAPQHGGRSGVSGTLRFDAVHEHHVRGLARVAEIKHQPTQEAMLTNLD